MAGLSNIFGGDNQQSDSSSDGSLGTDTVADLGNTIGLDANSAQSQESTDEDGNSQSSSNENSLSFDTDTDSLLGNVTDAAGMSDQSSSSSD
jgi:hypothetical protein